MRSYCSGAAKPKKKPKVADAEAKARAKRRRAEAIKKREPERPTRSSGRLRGVKAPDYQAERVIRDAGVDDDGEEDDEHRPIDYTVMPVEPEHLDDPEFEVYVALKAWRLRKCREIAVQRGEVRYEAYKICQNRTLCELVRRKRNDPQFCIDVPKPLATGFGREELSQAFKDQVLEVWGIGPSKVEAYCPEMVDVLDENRAKLQSSRDGLDSEVQPQAAAAVADPAPDSDASVAAVVSESPKLKPLAFSDFFKKKRKASP